MAFTGNVIASVVHGPLALVQKLKEELATEKLRGGTSTVLAAALDKLDQAAVVLAAFQEREAAIQTDANLSDQGKRTKMETTAKEFHAKLAFVEQAATDRTQAANELRKELDTLPKPPGDATIEWMRGAEIRAELRKADQATRMKLLAESLKRKDLSLLRAIENDPMGSGALVPAEFVARLREELLAQSRAEELSRWQALIFVSEKLQLLANVLDATLGKYRIDVPTFQTPPVTKTDLGQKNQQADPPKKSSIDVPLVGTFA